MDGEESFVLPVDQREVYCSGSPSVHWNLITVAEWRGMDGDAKGKIVGVSGGVGRTCDNHDMEAWVCPMMGGRSLL